VTLDGHPIVARSPCGVVVRTRQHSLPPIAHPAVLHVAGISSRDDILVAIDDAGLAARLADRGYDPAKLIAGDLADGAFRPLSPAELAAAELFARRPVPRRPSTM
jgi:hypothetical protein